MFKPTPLGNSLGLWLASSLSAYCLNFTDLSRDREVWKLCSFKLHETKIIVCHLAVQPVNLLAGRSDNNEVDRREVGIMRREQVIECEKSRTQNRRLDVPSVLFLRAIETVAHVQREQTAQIKFLFIQRVLEILFRNWSRVHFNLVVGRVHQVQRRNRNDPVISFKELVESSRDRRSVWRRVQNQNIQSTGQRAQAQQSAPKSHRHRATHKFQIRKLAEFWAIKYLCPRVQCK
ncbi:hypothetical protein OGAPHI_000354 [Ogataea philodendri]|uniref:Secreted protein n=1 Tax=Ogataea philodendri TaxID=1378263 RepID=A0A9P8PHU8_9ASCO|nr:uncharacterized protein OGAPHI_000354 [Ogataea philodendri]KAH3671649.1 hypothetical protein OGAPHI_000354 [Ogataea philodendri]